MLIVAETSPDLVSKVKANLNDWIKEAKAMEATVFANQPSQGNNNYAPPNNYTQQPSNNYSQQPSNNYSNGPSYSNNNSAPSNNSNPSQENRDTSPQ